MGGSDSYCDTIPHHNRPTTKSVMKSHCDVGVPFGSSSSDPTTPVKEGNSSKYQVRRKPGNNNHIGSLWFDYFVL